MISLETLAKIFEDDSFLVWIEDGQFVRREEINQKVAQWMRTNTNEYWMKRLDEFGAWYSVINDYKDVEENPQIQWNEYFNEMEHPAAGKIRLLAQPVRFNGQTYKGTSAPPCLGQHTVEILSSLNYTKDEIDTFLKTDVVRADEGRQDR